MGHFSLLHVESRLAVPIYTQPMRVRVACARPAPRRGRRGAGSFVQLQAMRCIKRIETVERRPYPRGSTVTSY